MRTTAKWIAIVWSVFCLIGVVIGMANVSGSLGEGDVEAQGFGFLGIGLGLGVWILIWFAVAGPAIIVYFVSSKKQPSAPAAQAGRTATSRLCIECGKYYEGEPKFCPNCGKPIRTGL